MVFFYKSEKNDFLFNSSDKIFNDLSKINSNQEKKQTIQKFRMSENYYRCL